MSDAVRFLTGLTQALSASVLYGEDHPVYRRAADAALRQLHDLQKAEGPKLEFSLLDGEVVFRERVLHELRTWEWTPRLAEAGIQRIEVTGGRARTSARRSCTCGPDGWRDAPSTARPSGRRGTAPSASAMSRSIESIPAPLP